MNLKNQPPVLVPEAYQPEIEKLSKAALMDLVWSFAARCAGSQADDPSLVMFALAIERDAILSIRKQRRSAS